MQAKKTISCAVVGALCVASGVHAAILNISAEIRSEVQAFVGGVAESSDEAIETSGDNSLTPPIDVRAVLENVTQADDLNAKGLAIAEFRDPILSGPDRNPEEISIEADCFSNDPSIHYELNSTVVERRIVSFSAAELRDPIGSTQTVRSALFASGAIFVWSTDATRDLTGLTGEVSFAVRRVDADENETVLLSDSVALRGGPDGTIEFDDADDLLVFFGDLTILPDVVAGGILPDVPDVDLGDLAIAQVAIILQQNLDYEYQVAAGEELALVAEFTTKIANLPDGTGVVAVFGRPFDEAAEIIGIGIPPDGAKRIETRLNRAIAEFKPIGPTATSSPLAAFCGMLGIEMLPLLVGSFALFHSRGARRRM